MINLYYIDDKEIGNQIKRISRRIGHIELISFGLTDSALRYDLPHELYRSILTL
jgi:hypothetical protein